jgi:rhodanese-related sulfurtransferase
VPAPRKELNMKPQFLAVLLLLGALVLMPAGLSSRALPNDSQQAASAAKAGQSASASSKDAIPFPQVPRITAEEVERQTKDKGNVVIVDTDDSESYAAEHIKGAVNVAYDPTADARAQDDMLSALPGDKLIVFYCNCPHEEDSAPLVLEMWQLGYDHDKVKALKGGLTRWEQLRYPLAGTDVGSSQEKGN